MGTIGRGPDLPRSLFTMSHYPEDRIARLRAEAEYDRVAASAFDKDRCYNCDGEGVVFAGVKGQPMIPDTSIPPLTCPVCHGKGLKPLTLF